MNREPGGGASLLLRLGIVAFSLVLGAVALGLISPGIAGAAAALPAGFREEVVLEGLNNPTNVEFADDGRVFVAEKSGVIKVFDDLSDTTPTTFADLRTNVYNYWDRGLLGLALDPDFPREPYVYALYTYNAPPGETAPYWKPEQDPDPCPSPTEEGCVVTGHLSRLQADVQNNTMVEEKVLIEDWCQQYPSHTVGDLAFGKDGALYVSAGDGASFDFADYGQKGDPANPCGDPPGGVGATLRPPTAEGGTLRSQDLRTNGDPVSLDGAILRVNPDTGAAMSNNPLIRNTDRNARRIVSYGLRNPFRFAIRPGTNEVWTSDTGWNQWEEINRIASPTAAPADNFGWPCYEGGGRQDQYDQTNLNLCENLYKKSGAVKKPYFAYSHGGRVVAGEACPPGASSVGGVAFYEGGRYPARYDGALFFADYSRRCIWAIEKGSNGLPDPSKARNLVTGASNPVELEIGPGGDLYYVDIGDFATPNSGAIRRISYGNGGGNAPVALARATSPTQGATPLRVTFDGTRSTGTGALDYDWDLDGDGAYDDSTDARPENVYSDPGTYEVRLRVTDGAGREDVSQPVRVVAGDAPKASIESPAANLRWRVGDKIRLSGSATDGQDRPIPSSDLSWTLTLRYCSTPQQNPSSCPARQLGTYSGNGRTVTAPDWKYPAYLEIELSARDSAGLEGTDTMVLRPKTVRMDFRSTPGGVKLAVSGDKFNTSFSRTVIVGSNNSISAPSFVKLRGKKYKFRGWSDGKARAHLVVAPDVPSKTYKASYKRKRR